MSFAQATPIKLANTARECQVSRATVEGYLEVLEDLLLGWRLPTFQRRAKRQLANHPEEIEGAALDGLVAQHLRAWVDDSNADLRLHYWRTKTGNEVDFVVFGKSAFHAIEVKNQRQVRPADLKGLIAFGEDYPEARRVLVYRGKDRVKKQGVLCLPCAEFFAGIRPGDRLPG